MDEIGNVVRRFGIVSGGNITEDQIKAMTLAVKAGELKLDHFKQVAGMTKSFNLVAVEAAKSLTSAIESAGIVKKSAIDSLRSIVEAMEKIATSTDNDDVKVKVIDLLMKIADKIEKADERNHGFAMGAMFLAASVIVSIIARRPVRIA